MIAVHSWEVSSVGTICYSGTNSIHPRGSFEVGDWLSMLSPETGNSTATHHIKETETTATEYYARHEAALATGSLCIEQNEQFSETKVERSFTVTTDKSLSLGDFVVRFVFDANEVESISLAGERFSHQGQNRYLQFPVEKLVVNGKREQFQLSIDSVELPNGFTPVLYARDEPTGQWVIHARAIAMEGDGFLRLYRGPWTRNSWLDSLMNKVPRLRNSLTYLRERTDIAGKWIPAQYVHTVSLGSTDRIAMKISGTFK
ncbi:hypothetical protein [Haladaptatus sp. ZSTT2]|uniref:hypothetical protein n=1 Tax=Haladaptatus sp. ZSTT2 TaxID=3120515 RepID=UPI00300EBDAF